MGKWEMVRLGDVCEVVSGSTPSTRNPDLWDGVVKWIAPAEISDDSYFIYETVKHISEKAGLKPMPAGTVLLSSRAPIGKVAIAAVEMCCNQGFKNLICSDKIHNQYLYRYLKSKTEYLNSLGRGATFKEISKAIVEAVTIPLPPLPVQQQISEVLDCASALIKKRKAQIEKLDLLVKSQFIEMFGDPVKNPKNWDMLRLGDIADVGSSKRVFVEELVDEGIPFYRGTEIGAMATGETITPTLFITKEHYELLRDASGVPDIGDLLMPSICPDGRIWRVNNENPFYFKDGRVLWVHFTEKTFNDTYILSALKERIIANYINIASGTTFAELKIFSLKSVCILIPPLKLQNQFADFVGQVEAQKSRLQASLQKLEQNYKSLMQKCFRGEIF